MTVKRKYETTFIVNAVLDDAKIEGVINNTLDFLKNNGATISTVNKWGRKRLAYSIEKKNNGYYVYAFYEAPTALIPQLERFFFLEENVIRHLTIKLSSKALKYRDDNADTLADVFVEPEEETGEEKAEDKKEGKKEADISVKVSTDEASSKEEEKAE